MDAYNTDVRPLLAELRESAGPRRRPVRRLRRAPATRSASPPSASAASRPAGAPETPPRTPSDASSLDREDLDDDEPRGQPTCSAAATGSAPTRATPTTPAATPPPRAPRPTRSPAQPVELLWVKGSGGDLGTLTEAGLAVLRLDRLRSLVDVYPGVDREDEMVAAFDYCLHGRGGAAPSIDTAMHGLVDAAHVDHLHPDSGIALATAADGEALTQRVLRRPRRLGAVAPARLPARPGHRRDRGEEPAGHRLHPRRPRHHRVGRHQRASARPTRLEIIRTAERFLAERGTAEPFGAGRARATRRCRRPSAAIKAAALAPVIRGLASHRQAAGRPLHRHRRRARLPGRAEHPRLAALGTSCPDHFLRTKVRPLVVDLPPTPRSRTSSPGCRSCTRRTAPTTPPTTSGTPTPDSPAMRGADPAIVLVPGVGMFSFGANKQTARVAGEFYVNAINVMRGAEAVSTYAPIDESEKFRIEYWALEEAKLAADAEAQAAGHPGRAGHRRGVAASARRSPTGWPPRAPASSSPTSTCRRRTDAAAEIGGTDVAIGVAADVTDAEAGGRRVRARPCSPSAGSTWSSTTPACRSPSRCWRPPSRTGTCSTT